MSFGFSEIDHLLGAMPDAFVGGVQYERLGFNVTPLSVIERMGVANRLVIFDPVAPGAANFIECMGIARPERVDPIMRKLLEGPPGIRSMVLATPNAQDSYEKLKATGYPFDPPRSLSRDWALPDGEVLTPAFNVVLPIDRPLGVNFCEYVNLAPYLRPEFRVHANTARHFTTVFVVAADPAEVAGSYSHMFGQSVVEQDGNFLVGPGIVKLCVGTLQSLAAILPATFLPAQLAAPAYVGFEIEVADSGACERLLENNGVPYEQMAGALITSRDYGCGNVIRFKPAAR